MQILVVIGIIIGFFYFLGKSGFKGLLKGVGFTIKGCLIFIVIIFVILLIISSLIK